MAIDENKNTGDTITTSEFNTVAGEINDLQEESLTHDIDMGTNNLLNAGKTEVNDGSAASPSISFTNDNDTGFFSANTNTELGLTVGGVERVRVDASGQVGVKTATPGNDLDVNGGINANTINTGQGDNELFAMDQNVRTTDAVIFNGITSSSTVDVSDNILINNNEIQEVSRIYFGATSGDVNLNRKGPGQLNLETTGGSGSGFIAVFDAAQSTTTFQVNENGPAWFQNVNVGIGTSSPSELFEVGGNILSSAGIITVEGGTPVSFATEGKRRLVLNESGGVSFQLVSSNTSESQITFTDTDDSNPGQIRYDHSSDLMTFRTSDSDNMVIDSSGRVGIGTGSPDRKFVVAEDTDTATYFQITNSGAGLTGTNGMEFIQNGTGNNLKFNFLLRENADMGFWTNGTERLTIDNVGTLKKINATEDLEIVDAGSTGATEQDWIEVKVGGVTGYIRVFASQ